MLELVKLLLLKIVDDIDSGSSNISNEEVEELVTTLRNFTQRDIPISKYLAYRYLNISRATFDNKVREGVIPRGTKVAGFKELMWYKKDLDKCIKYYEKESSIN